jgi:hypothetical protein
MPKNAGGPTQCERQVCASDSDSGSDSGSDTGSGNYSDSDSDSDNEDGEGSMGVEAEVSAGTNGNTNKNSCEPNPRVISERSGISNCNNDAVAAPSLRAGTVAHNRRNFLRSDSNSSRALSSYVMLASATRQKSLKLIEHEHAPSSSLVSISTEKTAQSAPP